MNVTPIILLLGLAGPEATRVAAASAGAAPEALEPGSLERAPPGRPEDVALWNALRDSQNGTMLQLGRVGQASYRIRYGRYAESLDEASRAATATRAAEARRLRSRIEAAAKQADEAIPKKGLRVRPCSYTLLHLDQRMRFPDDPVMAANLPEVRAEARRCVDELAPLAARLRPLAEALERALIDADAFLEPAEPAPRPPPPSAPAGAPPPGGKDGARP